MLQRRPSPRCTLCSRPCKRVGVHKLCSHRCSGTKEQDLHLWHIFNEQRGGLLISTQGYFNGTGLKGVFPEDVIDDELCQLCGEFDIPDEVLQRVGSLARA